MISNKQTKSKIAVIIFSIIVILSGWIGRGLDGLLGATGENSPGMWFGYFYL